MVKLRKSKIIFELLIHDKHMKQRYMYCISIIFLIRYLLEIFPKKRDILTANIYYNDSLKTLIVSNKILRMVGLLFFTHQFKPRAYKKFQLKLKVGYENRPYANIKSKSAHSHKVNILRCSLHILKKMPKEKLPLIISHLIVYKW